MRAAHPRARASGQESADLGDPVALFSSTGPLLQRPSFPKFSATPIATASLLRDLLGAQVGGNLVGGGPQRGQNRLLMSAQTHDFGV